MPLGKIKIFFDFDGTITATESMIHLAAKNLVYSNLKKLMQNSNNICGKEYERNFSERVAILVRYPITQISGDMSDVPLRQEIKDFISRHQMECVILTSNLDCWVNPILKQFGCEYYSSQSLIRGDKLLGIKSFTDKAQIVGTYRQKGYYTIFIGDGCNDLAALETADLGIVAGYASNVSRQMLMKADQRANTETELVNYLDSFFE